MLVTTLTAAWPGLDALLCQAADIASVELLC